MPQDLVQAQAWLMLSAHFGSRVARFMRNQLTPKMTEEQMKEARRVAHEWPADHYSSRSGEAGNSRGG